MMKKFFVFLLAMLAVSVTAGAEAESHLQLIQMGYIGGEETFELANTTNQEFYDLMLEGLLAQEEIIDVSAANVNVSGEELSDMITDVINSNPELYYVKSGYSYSTDETQIVEVIPQYDEKFTAELREKFQNEVNNVLAATVKSGMSDAEKALSVHDYLVSNIAYDVDYSNEDMYNAYGALIEKEAVCQGYTLLYMMLLRREGIECTYVRSPSTNHIWNIVKIGASWYHVDVTADDPTVNNVDAIGYVEHSSFLRSDAGIATTSALHANWIVTHSAPNDYYFDNEYPFYSSRAAWYPNDDGGFYCAITTNGMSKIYSSSFDGAQKTQLTDEMASAYPSLVKKGNFLYFIAYYRDCVQRLELETSDIVTVYTYEDYSARDQLFTMSIDDNGTMRVYDMSTQLVWQGDIRVLYNYSRWTSAGIVRVDFAALEMQNGNVYAAVYGDYGAEVHMVDADEGKGVFEFTTKGDVVFFFWNDAICPVY